MKFCPCCGNEVEQFITYRKRLGAQCPICESLERHRLLYLYLEQEVRIFSIGLKVLDCTPVEIMLERLREAKNLYYIPINPYCYPVDIDLQDTPFASNFFDVVIVSHILEHIDDDIKALREVLRILKFNGYAILIVPMKGTKTREFLRDEDDHVRLYGTDFRDKLEGLGFTVSIVESSQYDHIKYGLHLADKIYISRKKDDSRCI